jgi:hypothetical protein
MAINPWSIWRNRKMAGPGEVKAAQVPLIPYRTLRAFFEKVDPIPPRLDRSVLRYTSGSVQNALMTALRALDLMDENGNVREGMANLARAFKGGDRASIQKALQDRLRATYPSLFGDNFHMATATQAQLRQRFEEIGLSGDSVRKAVSFFLAACDEAGVAYSPHFKGRPGPRPGSRRSSPTNGATPKRTSGKVRTSPKNDRRQVPPEGDAPPSPPLPVPLAGILGLLPPDGEKWTKERRDKFVTTFQGVLDLCYPLEAEK